MIRLIARQLSDEFLSVFVLDINGLICGRSELPHWSVGDVRMFQFEDITGLENAFQLVLKHSPASGSTNSKYRLVTPVIIRNSMWYYYRGTKIVSYPKLRYYYMCCTASCETNARIQAGQDILSCS